MGDLGKLIVAQALKSCPKSHKSPNLVTACCERHYCVTLHLCFPNLSFDLLQSNCLKKISRWLDLNLNLLVWEATTLPSEPQPHPFLLYFKRHFWTLQDIGRSASRSVSVRRYKKFLCQFFESIFDFFSYLEKGVWVGADDDNLLNARTPFLIPGRNKEKRKREREMERVSIFVSHFLPYLSQK